MNRPFLRRLRTITLYVLGVLILLFLVGEITLRLMGYHARYSESRTVTGFRMEGDAKIAIVPGDKDKGFFLTHPERGYELRDGRFELNLDDQLTFQTRHKNGGRHSDLDVFPLLPLVEISWYGGSFTYGWGVDAAECWAGWGEDYPNYAVPGYGTLQSLMKLKENLEAEKPDSNVGRVAILGHASFHEQRNVCDPFWLQAISTQDVTSGFFYPWARLNGDSLMYGKAELKDEGWWLSRWSALFAFLETKMDASRARDLNAPEVTRRLVWDFIETCRQKGVVPVIAWLTDDADTHPLFAELKARGIYVFPIGENLDAPEKRIMPHDGHPNAEVHARMRKRLDAALAPVLDSLRASLKEGEIFPPDSL